MEPELVIASSSVDAGIGCWDLETGVKQPLHYKSCASTRHGLSAVGSRFLASSQLRDPKVKNGFIHYWSWSKPGVEVKSFLAEPIKPIAANPEGTYIVGGGISGKIYLWETATGRLLLERWEAHLRPITCLVFNDDGSLLVSGSEDGIVKVWPLLKVLDDRETDKPSHRYLYNFSDHTMPITDLVIGYGGWNAVIVSASEDRTCKVWSLSKGELLRSVAFPCIINALVLDPAETVFYAGGKDGKIYIVALSASSSSSKSPWLHIIGSLSSGSDAVTSLAYSTSKNWLLAGSEDGSIRVWDPKNMNLIRGFHHEKGILCLFPDLSSQFFPETGPVNNLQVTRRRKSSLPPPLQKFQASKDDKSLTDAVIALPHTNSNRLKAAYVTSPLIDNQLIELQQKGSSAAAEMGVAKVKHDLAESRQMVKRLKTTYESLHKFCMDEILEGDGPPKG
ncbi:unnamed protein product [Linum tenue]|uniref:Uncharacterized protein n=1 Tax=Linum tenue TaxID=586396 RepID=A0AAV0KSN4_9ROSI|nr:unnamed protein product [Linum tenue]CAI0558117.1 unnamed protein product [Linum tenue]